MSAASVNDDDDEDDSDDDFEEVEEMENPEAVVAAFERHDEGGDASNVSAAGTSGLNDEAAEASGAEGGVQVTVAVEDLQRDAKKKKMTNFDWEKHFESLARRHKKEVREAIHNVHLLCLLAR